MNNQGSTLLTVIICIAFIAILGSMMLSITMTNLQMKVIESKSKKNFYSTEMAMEEIRVVVQEIAAEAVKEVYENEVLKRYASFLAYTDIDLRNAEIQKLVITNIINNLAELGTPITPDQIDGMITTSTVLLLKENYFNAYISDPTNTTVSRPMLLCENLAGNYAIRIIDINIEYLNNDFRTKLSSDIVITMPKFSFAGGSTTALHYKVEQPYKDYVLIADGNISFRGTSGRTEVNGSVYAGGTEGISIDGLRNNLYQVNLSGKNIIARRAITVKDTAKLNIMTYDKEGVAHYPVIWANNLITKTDAAYSITSPSSTDLTINGISVIKDDLTIDGLNSNVNLNSGAYIGYTGTHSAFGSSIIINGAGSSLDLSRLSRLIIAGRAHVSVEDVHETDILTGESIAFKSNQRAYLLPGSFMVGVGHNPITQNDPIPSIGITNGDPSTGIPYNDFLAAATKYNIASKTTGSTLLRYYYFNFGSGKQADDYLRKYMSLSSYHSVLDYTEPFTLKSVLLTPESVSSVVGNQMSYDTTNKVELRTGLSANAAYTNDLALDQYIADISLSDEVFGRSVLNGSDKVGTLANLFSRINHNLYLDSTKAYVEADGVVSTGLKAGCVSTMIGTSSLGLSSGSPFTDFLKLSGNITITNSDVSKQYFHIIDGNVTIAANSVFKGMLIATGSITIEGGANITGLIVSTTPSSTVMLGDGVTMNGRIIAGGSIIIGKDCTLTADAATDTYLDTNVFATEGDLLHYIFNGVSLTVSYEINTPAESFVDLGNMISYENWRKVE